MAIRTFGLGTWEVFLGFSRIHFPITRFALKRNFFFFCPLSIIEMYFSSHMCSHTSSVSGGAHLIAGIRKKNPQKNTPKPGVCVLSVLHVVLCDCVCDCVCLLHTLTTRVGASSSSVARHQFPRWQTSAVSMAAASF